jgi:hypothetical protein
MLRHACAVLTHALTILLAPYFLHVGRCDEGFPGFCPAPYMMAILWVMVTALLLHVQVRAALSLPEATVCSIHSGLLSLPWLHCTERFIESGWPCVWLLAQLRKPATSTLTRSTQSMVRWCLEQLTALAPLAPCTPSRRHPTSTHWI